MRIFFNLIFGYRVTLILLLIPTLMQAAHAANDGWASCVGKTHDSERLKCFDALTELSREAVRVLETRSYLTRSWDLDNRDDEVLGDAQSTLRPYRGTYLIARGTDSPNLNPATPGNPTSVPLAIDRAELKFQFSQKAKVLNALRASFLGFTGMRLWGTYTQQTNWQAFNTGNSSPIRETNYEPELILTLSTGNQSGLKLINLGLSHQSNGRDLPLSRGWNRGYLQGGWEGATVSVLVRAWWRVPESRDYDDNSDIDVYIGRGDIALRWEPDDRSQVIDLTLRNNLRSDENRGFIQIDWATPVVVSKSIKLHLQFTSGYGESMVDYNHYQKTLGVGLSFRDW